MANIFISYNREDEDKTKALVDDIEELGHTVWFDHELSGGQKWWAAILESIRNCDILVFALSNESLNSSACSLEYDYASKLGKTILPVLVGEGVSINLLPPVLSQIQFVDYRDPDRDALLHLAKALTAAPSSQPLPDPLPIPPEVPISYLGKLGKQIGETSKLSYEEQSTLLVDLKRGLHDPETAKDTRTLLQKLRKRQYLFENIAREIDELLDDVAQNTKKSTFDPNNKGIIEKQSLNQDMKNNNVHKKKSWTSSLIIFIGLLIAVGLYFIYPYITAPDQYSYVCYDKKTEGSNNELFYKGCEIHTSDCTSNAKEKFGRYLNKVDAKAAYKRCIKGTPRSVPATPKPKEDVSTLLKRAKAYYYGNSSMQQDYVKSKEYFLKAAKLNSKDAYRYLGVIYLFGQGVAVNKDEAKRWLQMAINLGDERSKELYRRYIDQKEKVFSFNENGISIRLTYPSSVRIGQSFTLHAEMRNNYKKAKQGGLTLSFPNTKWIPVLIVHNNFSQVDRFSSPQKIWNKQARKTSAAKYFMVEGWQRKSWLKGKTKSFSIALTVPGGLDELKVNLRGIIWIKNSKDTLEIPSSSNIHDQQGYAVKQLTIKINR